jgi:hypothetical protein
VKLFRKIVKWSAIGLTALLLVTVGGFGLLYARVTWWDNRPKVDCPILAYLRPISHAPITASNYLEIFTVSAWGYEPVRIRIYGNGNVERDTTVVIFNGQTLGCPLHEADKHLRIPPKDAVYLLTRARDGGFCRLCGRYVHRGVSDAGGELVTLSLGGKVKSVDSRAGTPPPLFNELIESTFRLSPMDNLADTRKFTREREDECSIFSEQQEALHPFPK